MLSHPAMLTTYRTDEQSELEPGRRAGIPEDYLAQSGAV